MLWEKESLQTGAPFVDICKKYATSMFGDMLDSDESTAAANKSSKISKHYRSKGMQQCKSGNWREAIELFNQALCFAEKRSTDVGCAYGDRSNCFFNLKMYEKCLVDIKLAHLNNCEAAMLPKLSKLAANCKKLLKTTASGTDASNFMPKLSSAPNEFCPCLADIVQIEIDTSEAPTIKRHIIADCDIEVGKTIMMEEGFVWTTCEKYKRCCLCLETETNLVPCGMCTDNMVCHDSCEKSGLHEIECLMDLRTNDDNESNGSIGNNEHAVVRSLFKALKIIPGVNELQRFVENIVSNRKSGVTHSILTPLSEYAIFLENGLKEMHRFPKKERNSLYKHVDRIFDAVIEDGTFASLFDSVGRHRFLMHLIGHHMCSLRYAAAGVVVGENDGTTICPIVGGFFRHSCNPNAALVTSDRSTIVITIQPIKEGDEITICYNLDELHRSKKSRQQSLLKNYGFKCSCKRCSGAVRRSGEGLQFKCDKRATSIEAMTISQRNKLEKGCIKFLMETDPEDWSDQKCSAISDYTRFLRAQYYLKL